jgi:hypothetical protein
MLTSTLKSKEFEIQTEKNKKEELDRLYNNEYQKNIKLNNQISFFRQIINDKENEINNMRKSLTSFKNYKQLNNNNMNNEFKNKIIEENETLKAKAKEYNILQISYNKLNDDYNTISQKVSQYQEMQNEFNKIKEEKEKISEENNKFKKLLEVLNNLNKNLLYENTLNRNSNNMSAIIGNNEKKNLNENYDNKYEKYLSTNVDELYQKLILLFNNKIENETQIKKLNETNEALSNKIIEYDSTLKEIKSYIEQLEKCNKDYQIYFENNEAEKNNIFKQNILDRIKNEQFNDSLNIQKRKSLN